MGNWFAVIFYLLAWVILGLGFLIYKKSNKKLYGITWIGLTFILITCYQTFIAAIINLVSIPVNLFTIGIFDLLAGLLFWFMIYRGKRRQQYYFGRIDAAFVVILLVVIVIFDLLHCEGHNLYISYLTIDPAAHLKAAVDVIVNQRVNNMFYSALFNGLFLNLFTPFRSLSLMYQPFVLSDIMNYALAAFMFYGVIRRYMNTKFQKITGLIVTFLYLFAYPLDSILYGFVYLGMGVTLCIMLVELARIYLTDELNEWFAIGLLSLGCLAIVECYILFAPVMFFTLLLCVAIKQWNNRKLISFHTIGRCLAIFLIPCIIGIIYTYAGIFTDGVTVASAINTEGGIYRDLYSNFLPFLPLAIYSLCMHLKEKKNSFVIWLCLICVVFMLILFGLGMCGKVSSYYYYKMPYLFWLPLMLLTFDGALRIAKQMKGVVISYFGVWFAVLLLCVTGAENKISQQAALFVPTVKSGYFNDIYEYNLAGLLQDGYSYEKMQLYQYVYSELLVKQQEEAVAICSFYQDDIWFQAITNQRLNGWDFVSKDHVAYYQKLDEVNPKYVVVLTEKNSEIYHDNEAYWDSLEKVYETPAGFIAIRR